MIENIEILLFCSILSIPIAVVGFVYSYVLTREDMLLERPYIHAINHLPAWINMPLISCYLCVTGQLALWLFPLFIIYVLGIQYDFFLHVYFISQSILNVQALKHFYSKIE